MATQLIDYVDYDFDRLVTQLTNRLKATSTWKDTYRSSTGQMMIELYAYVANLVLYYIERRAEESYIETAQMKSSVINLVRLLNYNPKRKVSSQGVLKFYVQNPHASRVYIPQYTECKTTSGVKYVTPGDNYISVGSLSVSMAAIQGYIVSNVYSSTGVVNQEYQISDDSVENSHLWVYVNNELWTEVSSFASSTATSKHYKVRTELDTTITIIFGDGVFGVSPSYGDIVGIKYIKSAGGDGNIYQEDKIVVINTSIYDELNNSVTDINVTNASGDPNNPSFFMGGENAEDIETIRAEAPKVFKTGDRAITRDDFTAIVENYSGVGDANIWGENEENPPNVALFNIIRICLLMQDWVQPSSNFKALLSAYLFTKTMLTTKYEYTPAIILYVVPTMTVRINRGYTKSQSEININNALKTRFTLGTTAKLGQPKRASDIISTVESLQEVSYVHMTLQVRKTLQNYYDSYYQYGEVLEATPIIADSVRVLVGDADSTAITIAHTNALGVLVPDDSSIYVAGTINLITGYVGIDAALPSGMSIWIRYQQDNVALGFSGDVLVNKDQICKLYNDMADITEIKYTDEA